MTPREERQSVLIPARMRVGTRWCDARILNISSRGLMLHASDPPPRGSYLEVRRGEHVIVARVVWAVEERLGVRTQDVIAAERIVLDLPPAPPPRAGNGERRAAPRKPAVAHEQSRLRARSFEFGAIVLISAALGAGAYNMVGELFASPMAKVEAALGQHG